MCGIQAPSSSGRSVAFEAGVTQWYRTPALGDTAIATLLAKVRCHGRSCEQGLTRAVVASMRAVASREGLNFSPLAG